MRHRIHGQICQIPARDWDHLHDGRNPFLRHAFLNALERYGTAVPENGWQPHHLTLYDGGRLTGAVPLYLKTNSWGEFVFDWSWAHAAHDAGLRYYPKLLAAIPYTPVAGPRLLARDAATRRHLARAMKEEMDSCNASGAHVNFVTDDDADALVEAGFLLREDVQFHWRNPGYRSFEDFLGELTHKRRKAIRHERRQVKDAGVAFDVVAGSQSGPAHWRTMHGFYEQTFLRKGNDPVITLDCFEHLGETLGDSVLLILARKAQRPIAGAMFLRGGDTLYGRYWGADETFPGLHFETCYYQGIEYCIREGLTCFEPGAQGEHKMLRGFLPVTTRSCHWLKHPGLHRAVDTSLREERSLIGYYRNDLLTHSPYRKVS